MKKDTTNAEKGKAVQVLLPEWADDLLKQYQRLAEAKGEGYVKKPQVILLILERYRQEFGEHIAREAFYLAQDKIIGKP